MDDTKVLSIKYKVITSESVDFDKAPPLCIKQPGFDVDLADGIAVFRMIDDVSTVEAAKTIVEPFIEAWELLSGITNDPGDFRLEYVDANVVERNPRPGHIVVRLDSAIIKMTMHPIKAHISRASYPDPPSNFAVSPLVSAMYYQYQGLCSRKLALGGVAYFCLDMLEHSTGSKAARRAAAAMYAIDYDVLAKLGELSTVAGGPDARKADGHSRPYTPKERRWLEHTVRILIKRVGEYAGSPNGLAQITLRDLPPL